MLLRTRLMVDLPPQPVSSARREAPLYVAPFDFFLQGLDLVDHALEARIDLKRLAIGIERALVVADVLHDEAEARQRPEMPRLAGQHLADVGERIGIILFHEIDG